MDKLKSDDLNFLFLINKCTFLLEYVDIYYQKEILNDINRFIKNLNDNFSKQYFENENIKKDKKFEILNKYFENLINEQILYLIDIYHKDEKNNIIIICEKKANKIILEKKKNIEAELDNNLQKKVNHSVKEIKNNFYKNIDFDKNMNFTNLDNILQEKIELFFLHFENKLKKDIDFILKENVYSNVNKLIESNNNILHEKIEDFLKMFFKEENIFNKISKKIKNDLNDVYKHLEENKKILHEFEKIKKLIDDNEKNLNNLENNIYRKVNVNFEEKIKLLAVIFNDTMNNIAHKLNNKIDNIDQNNNTNNNHYQDNINNINDIINKNILEKIENNIQSNLNNTFSKNNFQIKFNKENNDIELYYFNELITSTKINIKGLIGPRGPPGVQGEKGDLTIIRNINIEKDEKLKFTLQNGNTIYEVLSNQPIPKAEKGPPGSKGDKGDPGEVHINLKWEQENVMKINRENQDSLIFLKSLCVGENSHCLKNNSLSIGGSICYKDNSMAIGNNSKTFNSNSIAYFGSTLGKNSISYFAENIEENCIGFGNKNNEKYNIEKINLRAKEISFDCDELIVNDNILKNKYLKILEERVTYLENQLLLIKNNN